jgi:hypothetical protein
MSIKLRIIQWLAARLPKHPDGHIWSADNVLYMGRYIILNARWLHIRLHHINAADPEPELHDHPAAFASIVLNGGYAEALPLTVNPCFDRRTGTEACRMLWCVAGSVALRHAATRHKIAAVAPDTWTLFIFLGRRHQWWGYYTPNGKVYCQDFFKTSGLKKAA